MKSLHSHEQTTKLHPSIWRVQVLPPVLAYEYHCFPPFSHAALTQHEITHGPHLHEQTTGFPTSIWRVHIPANFSKGVAPVVFSTNTAYKHARSFFLVTEHTFDRTDTITILSC